MSSRPPLGTRSAQNERIARLASLRDEIRSDQSTIETGCVRLAEAMASSCVRLAAAARHADFSPPEWPTGIERTLEVKLSETREVTLRMDARRAGEAPGGIGGGA
jgi:hypothetical protein